jgi:hypothetical protein
MELADLGRDRAVSEATVSRWRALAGSRPLHFVLAGLVLHLLAGTTREVQVPEPVVLDEAARAQLRAAWTASMGREPSAQELAALERRELDDELLFREALARGLERRDEVVRQRLLLNMRFLGAAADADEARLLEQAWAMDMPRNDLVVRRRLVQVMEFALGEGADRSPATEAELAAMYSERREEFAEPPRWQLVQVYFSADRRGAASPTDATAALARFREASLGPDRGIEAGDPFLGGHRLPSLGAPQLAAQFGQAFVDGLGACTVQAWCGPVPSAFGQHLVWVEAFQPARLPGLEDPSVRRRLETDVQRARAERRVADGLAALRRKYGVPS